MSTTLTGNAASVVLADPVAATAPADGDALNAASVNTATQTELNQLALIRQSVYGGATDLVTLFRSTTTPTINKLIGEWNITGTVKGRLYACNDAFLGVVRTVNAEYTGNVGAEWKTDLNAPAILVIEETTGVTQYGRAATAPAAPWANAGWTQTQFFSRLGAITAATDLVATAGFIQAAAGNVIASGTPVGSAGPGLVKAERFYSTGTAMTNGQFATLTNWGSGGNVSSSYGTDTGGFVVIEALGAAPAPAADPSFVFTFKDGTFTNVPAFMCQLAFTDDGTITVYNSGVEITNASATTATVTLRTNGVAPTASKLFRFHWMAIGV